MLLPVQVAVAVTGAGGVVHRERDRVGDEHDLHLLVGNARELTQGVRHEARVGAREARVRRELTHLVDAQGALGDAAVLGQLVRGRREILTVLTARTVGGVGARRQRDDAARAVGVRLAQRVGEERFGVAVAPHDRRRDAATLELGAQRRDEGTVLIVDGAAPTHDLVVVRDVGEPLVGDAAPGRHAAQERHDLVGLLRAAERREQHRVVGLEGVRFGHGRSPVRRGCGALRSRMTATMRSTKTMTTQHHSTGTL